MDEALLGGVAGGLEPSVKFGARGSCRRTARENAGQSYRLAAEIRPHQVFAAVRGVTLVEEQIQHVEHALEPRSELARERDLDRDLLLADLPLGADQALGNGIRLGKEGRR